MKWITRSRPKTDRIACPWLIRRFIDPDAQILFVPADQVLDVAAAEGGHSFDARGATYTHRTTGEGERCTPVCPGLGRDRRDEAQSTAGRPPPAGPPTVNGLASVSPIRLVPARMGTDRKSIMAVEPGSFQQTATAMPRLLAGAGLSALAANRAAVIVNSEIADGFSVKPATPSP